MTRKVLSTNTFLKDRERSRKRGLNLNKLAHIVELLSEDQALPPRCRPHTLSGDWSDCWECHLGPDWLLIYRFEEDELHLIRTGTHSDLF